MKRIFFGILIVLLAFIVACKPKAEVTQITTQKIDRPTQATGVTQESIDTKIEAAEKSCSDWFSKNVGERSCATVLSQTASIGDTVVFPFAIKNQMPRPLRVAISLKFIKVQSGTVGKVPLEADKNTMREWLAVNDLETYYELEAQKILSKPVLIKVGDMIGEGKPTAPGYTYVFEVQAMTYEDGFLETYDSPKQLSVKVI